MAIDSGIPPDALHQLRTLPGYFTGRAEELASVIATLRQQSGGLSVAVCVHGAAGVGKTVLAMAAGHAVREAFPDAQIVVELNTHGAAPITAAQARDRVLRVFHPQSRLADDESTLWSAYRSTLSRLRVLLIVDDSNDAPQTMQLLPPPPSAAIFTSRAALPFGAPVHLGVLPRDDAVRMLRMLCDRLSEADSHELASAVGDHAKALEIAGGYLRTRRSKPVQEYLDELRRSPVERLDLTSLLEGSWFALTPAQRDALGALSVMPTDFDRQAAIALIGAAEGAAPSDALDELVAFNLLSFDEVRGRYFWHDLVRAFAMETINDAARADAQLRHAAHFVQVARSADAFYRLGDANMIGALALFDRERVHIESAFANVRRLQQLDRVLDLVDAVVHTGQKLRFRPSQRIEWLTAAVDAARALGRKQAEGVALGNLAWAFLDLGDLRRAAELYQRNLDICSAIGDLKGMSNALGGLGNAYGELGDHRRAVALFEQALTMHRDIGDAPGVVADLGNLGLAHANLGDSQRAIAYLEQQLEAARSVGDLYSEGNALGNLGLAYSNSGDWPRAMDLWEKRLSICQRIGDRRGEGHAWGNIGTAHARQGDFARARVCFERELTIVRAIGDRRSEGNVLGNLGATLVELKDARRAAQCYAAQALIMRQFGDRGAEALARWRLGLCHEALGEVDQALGHMQFYVDYLRERKHPNVEKLAARVSELQRKTAGNAAKPTHTPD